MSLVRLMRLTIPIRVIILICLMCLLNLASYASKNNHSRKKLLSTANGLRMHATTRAWT